MKNFKINKQDIQKMIKDTEKDYEASKNSYKNFLDSAKKTINNFLVIKMYFMSFIGILFSVILSSEEKYSKIFLIILSFILFLLFLLLIDDLWDKFKMYEKNIKEQEEETVLYSIIHSATVQLKNTKEINEQVEKFWNYGKNAEDRINKKRKIKKLMDSGESIDNIIQKTKMKKSWKLDFVLWAILFLFIPTLFLLEVFHFF